MYDFLLPSECIRALAAAFAAIRQTFEAHHLKRVALQGCWDINHVLVLMGH